MPAPFFNPVGTFELVTHGANDSGQNQSFSSVNFGAEHNSRRIVVGVHWIFGATDRNLSSVTIGGISAIVHGQDSHTGGATGLGGAIASAAVPTGTSGTITLGFSGTVSRAVISVFRATNLASTTPYAVRTKRGFNDTDVSDTIDIPSNGTLLIIGTGSTNTTGNDVVITGASEIYDTDFPVTGTRGAALSTGLSAQIGRTTRYNMGSIPDSGVEMICTSWQLK